MQFEEAMARLIQRKEGLDFLPVIRDVEYEAGGDYQLGEYTWGHDDASLTVKYRDPRKTPGKTFEFFVDLEYYNVQPYEVDLKTFKFIQPEGPQPRTGFAGFMQDLLDAARDE